MTEAIDNEQADEAQAEQAMTELAGSAEVAAEVQQGAPEGDEAQPNRLSSEAAKYRRQLRDTEAERDQLRAALQEAQKAIFAKELDAFTMRAGSGESITLHPSALADVELPEGLFPSGQLDRDAAIEFLNALYEAKPYMFHTRQVRRPPTNRPVEYLSMSASSGPELRPSFTDAFRPQH